MDIVNDWLLAPIVGEIFNHQAVIICEPRDKSFPLNYRIVESNCEIPALKVGIFDITTDTKVSNLNTELRSVLLSDSLQESNYEMGTSSHAPLSSSQDSSILTRGVSEIPQQISKRSNDYNHEVNVTLTSNGPTRIVVDFPGESDAEYILEWYQMTPEGKKHIFHHGIRDANKADKLIFVSCDFLEADTNIEDSMWTRMQEELIPKRNSASLGQRPNQQTCLIHMGDQAYMDKVFKDCVHLTLTQGQNNNTAVQILRAFGQRYCDTWMPHHNILAGLSNYHIWDDHEIKNNLTLNDLTISEDEKYVRDLAIQAYIQYQESLHLKQTEILSRYSWCKRMGDLLIIAIERTSRNIPVSEILQAITNQTEQNQIMTLDSTRQRPDTINRLILCFVSAPIPPPHGTYGSLYRKLTGDKGTTKTSKFWPADELADLYKGLFDWMENDRNREVLVVGGDLHFGTYGVARRGTLSIPVVIASPITNQPTTDRWLASKGMKGTHHITNSSEGNITFTTIASRARRCYATVNLNTVPMHIIMKYSAHKLPKSNLKYLKTILSFR
ncbi:Hypothetical protein HVR_LOCUS740 [uncultured virus]|nr:Hypothetical protein HVR_LOCUS740 [uncultured virus]